MAEIRNPGPLILASTSPYRRDLLARLGLPFECRAPLVDEEALKPELTGLEPKEVALRLARAKAVSLRESEPGATLVGSDQLVAFEGRILGKPGSVERAESQLLVMSGRSHQLITALCVCCHDHVDDHVDVAVLTMRALGREEISRYVAADRPLDCAGAYKLEQRGIALFDRIDAADHSAITGLPLIALVSMLRELGYTVP
jgi:septum formation protein